MMENDANVIHTIRRKERNVTKSGGCVQSVPLTQNFQPSQITEKKAKKKRLMKKNVKKKKTPPTPEKLGTSPSGDFSNLLLLVSS